MKKLRRWWQQITKPFRRRLPEELDNMTIIRMLSIKGKQK